MLAGVCVVSATFATGSRTKNHSNYLGLSCIMSHVGTKFC